MDKDFIKELLSTEDGKSDKLIKNGDFIDNELLKIMEKSPKKNLQKIFYCYKGHMPNGGYKYFVEVQCPICEKLCTKSVSKNKLMQILGYSATYSSDKYVCYCEKCKANAAMEDERKRRESDIAWKEKQKQKTQNYIDNYLNPNNSFKDELTANEKINYIMGDFWGCNDTIDDKITEVILQMNYKDFLNTPYWDGVRNYKLKKSKYRCQLCGNKGVLNVHHKTYENHGREHIKSVADSDLIVLCKDCHEKFHDKLDNKVV